MSQRFVPVSDFNKARELYHAGLLWWIPERLPCGDFWPVTFDSKRDDWPGGFEIYKSEYGLLLEE